MTPDHQRAISQLRHLYMLMLTGQAEDPAGLARSLLGPAIESLDPLGAATPATPTTLGSITLTGRENQIATLIAREGLSNKEMATRLEISDHTVKFHLNSIMKKLGAPTRSRAVIELHKRGLVAA